MGNLLSCSSAGPALATAVANGEVAEARKVREGLQALYSLRLSACRALPVQSSGANHCSALSAVDSDSRRDDQEVPLGLYCVSRVHIASLPTVLIVGISSHILISLRWCCCWQILQSNSDAAYYQPLRGGKSMVAVAAGKPAAD